MIQTLTNEHARQPVSQSELGEEATVEELLSRIRATLEADSSISHRRRCKRLSDLRLSLNAACDHLNVGRAAILIHQLVGVRPALKRHLILRGVSPAQVYRRMGGIKQLLKFAEQFGWSPATFALEREWDIISKAVKYHTGGPSIVKHAVLRKRHPSDFDASDLELWGRERTDEGKTELYVSEAHAEFRKAIRDAGLKASLPSLDVSLQVQPSIRLHLTDMTAPLRHEVTNMVRRAGRSAAHREGQSGARPAIELQKRLEELCGFAARKLGIDPLTSLEQILSTANIRSYVVWLFQQRRNSRLAVMQKMARIRRALKEDPKYSARDFRWILDILKEIPAEAKSEVFLRKRERLLRYEDLAAMLSPIADQIRNRKPMTKAWAWRLHDWMMMAFLTLHLWKPSLIRTCRISGPDPNLWRGPISQSGTPLAVFGWVARMVEDSPRFPVWQFQFRSPELRKGDDGFRGLILTEIISTLEAYVTLARPLLVGTVDPGTLFLNRAGGALTTVQLTQRVANLTKRHAGKRITPSGFRTAFAYHWLGRNPRDYARLAKILGQELSSVLRQYDPTYRPKRWRRT